MAPSDAQLHEWLSGSIRKLDLPVAIIDGMHIRDRVILVALGIDSQDNKANSCWSRMIANGSFVRAVL